MLTNGLVLAAGGADFAGNAFSSAELYNPSSGTWSFTSSLNTARFGATATMLTNGTVLFAAGDNGSSYLTSAEIYHYAVPIITTVAGDQSLGSGYSGDHGPVLSASMYFPLNVAFDSAGNKYIADTDNNVIRKVNTSGTITTVAGNYALGGTYSGDGGAATAAGLDYPMGITVDSSGNLYIADEMNHLIRKVDTSGTITTVVGDYSLGGTYSGDGGPATSAGLNYPVGVTLDASGNLYVCDAGNNVVRLVDTSGTITTIVGNGTGGYSGDGGPATSASLGAPFCVAFDDAGKMYIADYNNGLIRMVDTSDNIWTVAGNVSNTGTYVGDGGPATSAGLSYPSGVAVDRSGNIYIADAWNQAVRKVDATGTITTLTGNGTMGYSGDGGPAVNAITHFPSGVTLDNVDNLYISDCYNNVIRKITF